MHVAVRRSNTRHPLSSPRHDIVIEPLEEERPPTRFGYDMAGKALSVHPTIDPSAKLHETRLGAYTEVGARTILHEVTMAPAAITAPVPMLRPGRTAAP